MHGVYHIFSRGCYNHSMSMPTSLRVGELGPIIPYYLLLSTAVSGGLETEFYEVVLL